MSKLIIFDTETTGLEDEDKIIQVGAIVSDLKDAADIKVYDELCAAKDGVSIKIEAMATHGIREEQIKGKPLFIETDFMKELTLLNSEENYLIAHNLDFDLKMLEKEGFKNKLKLIDTLQCAKHLFEIGEKINGYKLPNHQLQTYRYIMFSQKQENMEAEKLGVEIKAHEAIGDVVILRMFLRELYKKVMHKFQIKNSIEIMNKMVELTKTAIPVEKIRFPVGKYRGQKIVDIEKENPGLLTWYITKYDNPLKEVVEAIEKLRKKDAVGTKQEIDF